MIKKLFILIALAAIYVSLTVHVHAQYGQYTPPSLGILVDKWVGVPINTTKGGVTDYQYVDNLSTSDAKYAPGQAVPFKIKVKNTSNVNLYNVTVTDYLPGYLQPLEGPGNYDSNARTISFSAGDFAPGEEKYYYMKMQVYGTSQLPSDKGLFCVVNKVRAYNDQVSDDDTAQLCIEKQVSIPPGKPVPQAGPEMGLALLGGEVGLLALGVKIKSLYSKSK
ncbi:DUF11 domain-containing protein [Patescibacteria group bacterium]|nr:DUF11 domain-containing protein [Patescibacteria group bacterium]MCL5091960.1 DUF11 domain-containing protein [Patescibacteria group bacterium]